MNEALGRQLGAAVDALEGAIRACPDEVWNRGERWYPPWYLAFHTLFWLDYSLTESPASYAPPAPFTRGELEPDIFPDRVYSKEELLGLLQQGRRALATRLERVSTDEGARRFRHPQWSDLEAVELLLQSLRHVQHHVGQINLLIRQAGAQPAPWVRRGSGAGKATAARVEG